MISILSAGLFFIEIARRAGANKIFYGTETNRNLMPSIKHPKIIKS